MLYRRRMAFIARSGRSLIPAADVRHEGVNASLVRAGTYSLEVGDDVVTGWHSHDLHQVEYAFEGIAEVETATARYLLPPSRPYGSRPV